MFYQPHKKTRLARRVILYVLIIFLNTYTTALHCWNNNDHHENAYGAGNIIFPVC